MSRRILKPDGTYFVDFDDDAGFTKTKTSMVVDLSQQVVTHDDGEVVETLTSPSSATVSTSKTGEAVPSYRKLIASNNDATGFFSATMNWIRPGFVSAAITGDVTVYVDGQPRNVRRLVQYTGPANHNMVGTSSLSPENADQQARVKFYAKLRRELQDMSGGPFLGELGKTLRDIRRPAKALSDLSEDFARKEALRQLAARQLAKGYGPAYWNNPRKPKRPNGISSRQMERMVKDGIQRAGDAWLSYAFGALPLVNDIDGAAKAMASMVGTPLSRRVAAFGEDYQSSSESVDRSIFMSSSVYAKPLLYRLVYSDNDQAVVVYRAGLKSQCSFEDSSPLDQVIKLGGRFGLSPGELVSTAYELTPWSFLVDYFSSLGDLVNAAALSTSEIAWVNKTSRVIRERKTSGVIDFPYTTAQYNAGGWRNVAYTGDINPSTSFSKSVVRSKISSVPLPRLEFRFTPTPMKLANIAALLGGLLRGSKT